MSPDRARLPTFEHPVLFQQDCASCFAFSECGGAPSAPCTCRWTGTRRHDCDSCSLNCVERRIIGPNLEIIDSFRDQLSDGLPLGLLRVEQSELVRLPSGIVVKSSALPPGTVLQEEWVGVHLRDVIAIANGGRSRWVRTRTGLHARLKVSRDTRLLAVLNGNDHLLERLWAMNRDRMFKVFRRIGLTTITGPTFSVTAEPLDVPASHNVTMMMRHHRFCAEASAAGLRVIPNVYCRSERQADMWIEWLRANPNVHTIARDFSRTKDHHRFEPELAELMGIVRGANRRLHVVVSGIGEAKFDLVGAAMRAHGSSLSILSSRAVVRPLAVGETRIGTIHEFIATAARLATAA